MILHVHTTNNIWFILDNSLIQEGKHMDGKLEGTLSHYFGSKRRKRQLTKEEEKRAPKYSQSWPDLIFQNTFGVLPITFDSDVQMSCYLMIWKVNRMAYKYVSNRHLQRRLIRGSNCCLKLESDLCPNIYWNCVVFFFIDFGSLACKTYYFSVIQVISCLLKCSYI